MPGCQPPRCASWLVAYQQGVSVSQFLLHKSHNFDQTACLFAPAVWFGSLFQRKRDRFLGKYRYWAEPAQPPEDFIYEVCASPVRWLMSLRLCLRDCEAVAARGTATSAACLQRLDSAAEGLLNWQYLSET